MLFENKIRWKFRQKMMHNNVVEISKFQAQKLGIDYDFMLGA